MSAEFSAPPTIEQLADRLEGDIRRRGLRPGDRYLTAAEASREFSVSSMTAHRAMQSLAERNVLVRLRSRGTFVGPSMGAEAPIARELDELHVVAATDHQLTNRRVNVDVLADELARLMPETRVEIHALVDSAAERSIQRTLSELPAERRSGFVLIRCIREVQQCVCDSGRPAVIFGQPYPGIRLSSVSHDQPAVGRLMAEHALRQGARRLAVLTHAQWRYGDHQMIDAATSALAAGGVALSDVKLRSLPPEREAVELAVHEILNDDRPPEAFLCRNDFYAQLVAGVLDGCSFADGKPCVISGAHDPADDNATSPFPRVAAQLPLSAQVERLANLLLHAARDRAAEHVQLVIPVALTD
jgi:DNA-binding transcriptional regulator YhcF (GntR family)